MLRFVVGPFFPSIYSSMTKCTAGASLEQKRPNENRNNSLFVQIICSGNFIKLKKVAKQDDLC